MPKPSTSVLCMVSALRLSQDLSITRKEAEQYKNYFETYPKIKGFLDNLVQQAKDEGYVSTMFGRRRPVPEPKSSNSLCKVPLGSGSRGISLQGTARDIIKIAMIQVSRRLKEENLKSRLILQIHDELLIETAEDEVEQVSAILEQEMKGAAELSVSLEIDMHTGKSWYEAK